MSTWREGSNEYPQSMFWIKNRKIVYPLIHQFYYKKVGFKWVYMSLTCYPDGKKTKAQISCMVTGQHLCFGYIYCTVPLFF